MTHAEDVVGEIIIPETLFFIAVATISNSFFISLFSKSLRIPPVLNIQYENGEYFFITPGYIFISMNLSKNSSNDSFKDYYALSSGNMSYQYNQNYIGPYFNVGIGEEYSCELEALYGVGQLKTIKTDNHTI